MCISGGEPGCEYACECGYVSVNMCEHKCALVSVCEGSEYGL